MDRRRRWGVVSLERVPVARRRHYALFQGKLLLSSLNFLKHLIHVISLVNLTRFQQQNFLHQTLVLALQADVVL
jgi:hypothetical protein